MEPPWDRRPPAVGIGNISVAFPVDGGTPTLPGSWSVDISFDAWGH